MSNDLVASRWKLIELPFSFSTRYCEWQHLTVDQSKDIESFEEYKKTLKLDCEPGDAAVLNWTVSHDTPDLVYYQCYTHNNLGWKIHVVNPGTTLHRNNSFLGQSISALVISLSLILTALNLRNFCLL